MPELKITNEDCMELMKRYPDKYFELAIVDPPYGLKMKTVSIPSEKNTNSQQKFYKQLKEKKWDNVCPSPEYFKELKRVSKNQIIWGGNYMAENIGATKCILIWDKMTYIPTMSQFEFAFCSFNLHPKFVKINSTQLDRIHPTQKPITLYRWLLKNYAQEGDKILDTHLGSMSIAIAIHQINTELGMNLNLTGCELDKEYFEKGLERVNNFTRQNSLFDKKTD